jgi:gliding motility-associated-like protein
MIRFVVLLVMLTVLFRAYAQFAIVNENGQAISEITIISGVALQLTTNFYELGLEYATFDNNDSYSNEGPFQIGFDFQFYDELPSAFQISPTGFIIFEESPGFPLRFRNELLPFPNGVNLINSIYGCYMPWDPAGGQYVNVFREDDNQLVLTWCDVPVEMNPGQSVQTGTFQIVLHEDDVIDIHLIDIPRSDLFAGNATVGILSQVKTRYTTPPGRNNEAWPPRTQESWRFTPDNNYINYSVTPIQTTPVLVPEYIVWYELDQIGNEIREISSDLIAIVRPPMTTHYRAVLKSCWGQTIATAELRVVVEGVFPTAFNPNSENPANREFKMPAVPGAIISNFRLQVYNRWGQIVFETTDANTGWNGKMQNSGQECPSGIYNWIMMVDDNGKSPISNSGMVVLIR